MKTNWTHFICLCFHRKSFIALGFLCCSTETSSRGLEKQSSGLVFLGRKKVRNWGFFELVEMLEEQPKHRQAGIEAAEPSPKIPNPILYQDVQILRWSVFPSTRNAAEKI